MASLAPEHPEVTGPPAHPNLLRSVIKNAASLTSGRILLALLRFLVAIAIVQRAGLERFGEFALLLSFVLVAEWLSDFGLTDIAVRQIALDPGRRDATMGAFALTKAVQCLLAWAIMGAAIAALGYPEHVVRSGLIAGAAVILYGGVQLYRVKFRVEMTMERDVGAEIASALALLAAVWFAAGASLEWLALSYVIARGVNLLAAALLAGGRPPLGFGSRFRPELRVLVAAALPLGLTGLMVSAYDAMDAMALSRWSTNGEVGIFAVAMRIAMLAVVAEQALAAAVFPVLAARWERDRASFQKILQALLDWGMVLAGAMFCALYAGAQAVGIFVKQDPNAVAVVLQLLAWAVLARAIVTLVSPMVVISGRLIYTVWISMLVVTAKWLALTVLASRGAIGAAAAYLIAEIGVGLIPTVLLCQRAAGLHLDWSRPLRILAVAAVIVAAARYLGMEGSIAHGLLAFVLFLVLATATGAIRLQSLRQLSLGIARRRNGDA